MKLNDNNKQHKIIGTDDIFVSSNNSSIGKDLESLLIKQDQDILDLKRNVKWLYKYGGVGGNGSGGTGASSTKMQCTVEYTDINGVVTQKKLSDGDFLNILEGSKITVTCTIVSNKSLNEYVFSVNSLKTTIKATDVNGSISTTPTGNTVYTVTLVGETTVSLAFTVFTKVSELSHQIVLPGGILIQSNSSIYSSQIENAVYQFILTNNQPDNFASSINKVVINQVELKSNQYSIEESINSLTNSKILTLKVPLKEIFTVFDIYQITVNYTFGTDELTQTDQFIYQSENAFVYCWSDTVTVYNKHSDDPEFVNNYNNLINYRVYPARTDSITQRYSVSIHSGSNTTDVVVQSGTNNVYTIVNEVTETGVQEVPITFTLNGQAYTYYIYLKKAADTVYFFETDNGEKYYRTVSCDTENTNDDIITFPSKDPTIVGNPIVINNRTETLLKSTCKYFGTPTELDSVSNYVQSGGQDIGNLRIDGLFSFGFQYLGSNWDLPIVSITAENVSSVDLYKNSLKFGSNTQEICLPDDGKYHLVQLYFKSDYKISNEEGTININNTKQVVELYVDGVLEIKPFEIQNFFIEPNKTKLIYYPGLWRFNHIGVATFNGHPQDTYHTDFDCPCIARYIADFDPIIPSNYYQTYKTKVLGESLVEKFDKTIYDALSKHSSTSNNNPQWINFFNYGSGEYLNKFVSVDASVIASLAPSDMEIYCITPESTHLDPTESGFDKAPDTLNQFLYNTFKSYGENDLVTKVACSIQKYKTDKWVDLISNTGTDDSIQFYVKYQGSSTLLYSCKNFEIGANPILNQDGEQLPVYFTPDVNLFPYMEQSFNLKADVVDSSHSNNVVIGNFVNDYMVSPFNTTKKTYKSCLTGKPVLLFIKNNAIDPSDNKTVLDNSLIFLGIYSLNLNRSSVHNLGYSVLCDSSGNEIETTDNTINDERCCDTITKFHILQQTEKEDFGDSFAVAEVQDNGVLYDYSQFDSALLANRVLGDFYVSDNDRISKEYSSVFTRPFKALAQIIYNYVIKEGIFHAVDLKSKFTDKKALENPEIYYYTNDNGELVTIPHDGLVITANTLNDLTEGLPYHTYETTKDGNKVALINNPMHQFHLVCNAQGVPVSNQQQNFYYIETLNSLVYNAENPVAKIDMNAAVKYFVTCMAFAMIDSVQKNLTIKCPDTKNNNIWYLGFYDMDSAFGISNSGGKTSFQAYSDYVDNDGLIIQDYSPTHSAELFDTPSSFLFMYAKYLDIISNGAMSNNEEPTIYPYTEWVNLRSKGGVFESGEKFCEKYIDNYFGSINPLIWNLNYQYKYFSQTFNESTSDNESSRFNGTRRYARKEYLNQRFQYLDVLFGFRNAKTIGLSQNFYITNGNTTIPTNKDIKINNTMFPSFKKGVTGEINAEVSEQPKTPMVLQISASISKLFMTDSNGQAVVAGSVSSNTDCGFYGSGEITSISECGQFLKNPDADNNITNNKIKIIKITSNPNTSKNIKLVLDFKELESVTDITIGGSQRMYYNTITIKNSSGSMFNINNITLNNIECNSIEITTNIHVTNLNITNCVSGSFALSGITIDKLTHSSNQFTSESWTAVTYNSPINITNTRCTSLSFSNSNLVSIVYTSSFQFSTLTLNSINVTSTSTPLQQFKLQGTTTALKTVNINNVKISEFILNAGFSDTLSNPISGTLNLDFQNTSVNLSIPGLNNIEHIKLGKVQQCNLIDNAFNGCIKLIDLPSGVTYTIKGNYIFRRCNALSQNSMNACVLPKDTNYTGIFEHNQSVNENFVINWFNNHSANSLDRLFFDCKNVVMNYEVKNLSVTDGIPSSYKKFETAFIRAINDTTKMQTSILALFYFSNVNIFTKKIADALVAKGVTSIDSILGYNSERGNSFKSYQFIEQHALDQFRTVKLTNQVVSNYFERLPLCVINSDGDLILESSMSDYFTDNCKIQQLYYFSPLMIKGSSSIFGKELSFNFEDGFPASIKDLSLFTWISTINVTNMEKAFDKLSGCSLNAISFHGTSCLSSDDYTEYTDLCTMLFNKDSEGNLIPKINLNLDTSDADGTSFSFPKKVTQEDCIKIIDYYTGKKKELPYLFMGATIYNCTNDHFLDNKLTTFNNLIYTFAYTKFLDLAGRDLYLNIANAFWNGQYNTVNDKSVKVTTTIKDLKACFRSSYLQRFTESLTLKNVESLNSTFRDCHFSNENIIFTKAIPYASPEGIISIQPYTDKSFQILPDNFFSICYQSCDLSNCFRYDSFDAVDNLTGYLPIKNTLGLKPVFTLDNIFVGCNITYYPIDIEDENSNYIIFPKWYTIFTTTNKYNCYIPFPTTEPEKVVYLFEDANYIVGSYDTLPNMPNVSNSGGASYYYLRITEGGSAGQTYIKTHGTLQVAPNSSTFPDLSGQSNYSNMIPYRLAYTLRFNNVPTEVITGMKKNINNLKFQKTTHIIANLENNNKTYIFNGDEIDSTVQSKVVPN